MKHARAAQVLAEASMISEGPGASYVPAGCRAHDSKEPSGDNWSLYDQIALSFQRCHSPRALERAVDKAEAQLAAWRISPKSVPETSEERDRRILIEHEGASPEQVELREDLHPKAIRRLRLRNGREPESGAAIEVECRWTTRDERARRVLALKQQHGLSTRQIAEQMGVSHVTVLNDLAALR